MEPQYVTYTFQQAIMLVIKLTLPVLVVSLLAGILISLLKAATQINEMTMDFIVKIFGVAIVLVITIPWMLQLMVSYITELIVSLSALK